MKNLSRITLIGAILLLWVFKSYVALSQTSKETLVAEIEKNVLPHWSAKIMRT